MFNPSRKKNGDYTSPEMEVITISTEDIIVTSTPQQNGNLDNDGWT